MTDHKKRPRLRRPAMPIERHQKGPLGVAESGTVLICFEPECDWWTTSAFPLCMDELLTHNCGGSHGA